MAHTADKSLEKANYGLRGEILSPMEILAQSVSTMAPTTTLAATIPLLCALAGNGTWLAYVLATIAVLLVALCIGRYARHSASPGSPYTYASMTLPPWLGATVTWSLLLAYVATGCSVIGGFYHYANLLLHDATGHVYSAVLLAMLVTETGADVAELDVLIPSLTGTGMAGHSCGPLWLSGCEAKHWRELLASLECSPAVRGGILSLLLSNIFVPHRRVHENVLIQ